MPVVARANAGYSIRILIMAALCAGFAAWFAYDGWVRYLNIDDALVQTMKEKPTPEIADVRSQEILADWPGYKHATAAQIEQMGALVKQGRFEGWNTALDVRVQKLIVGALILAMFASLYFFVRYNRKRAIADETGLSPAKGVLIPWPNITRIDNTQWDKRGIVTITYTGAPANEPQTAVLDDYDLDNLPALLEEVATRATRAEFLPPASAGDPSTPAAS